MQTDTHNSLSKFCKEGEIQDTVRAKKKVPTLPGQEFLLPLELEFLK